MNNANIKRMIPLISAISLTATGCGDEMSKDYYEYNNAEKAVEKLCSTVAACTDRYMSEDDCEDEMMEEIRDVLSKEWSTQACAKAAVKYLNSVAQYYSALIDPKTCEYRDNEAKLDRLYYAYYDAYLELYEECGDIYL